MLFVCVREISLCFETAPPYSGRSVEDPSTHMSIVFLGFFRRLYEAMFVSMGA
jgi:hypothetical protein